MKNTVFMAKTAFPIILYLLKGFLQFRKITNSEEKTGLYILKYLFFINFPYWLDFNKNSFINLQEILQKFI